MGPAFPLIEEYISHTFDNIFTICTVSYLTDNKYTNICYFHALTSLTVINILNCGDFIYIKVYKVYKFPLICAISTTASVGIC